MGWATERPPRSSPRRLELLHPNLGRLHSVRSAWERERVKTKLGRLVWEEGMETSQEAWAGILRAEQCFSPGSRVRKEGKGWCRQESRRPKERGGRRE